MTAVDANEDQLRLVALKVGAAATLDPATLHRWFELGRDPAAAAVYRSRVRPRLALGDAAFWDARIGILERGLHEHAGVGRPFALAGRIVRQLRPGLAPFIESVPDPATQAEWWRRHLRPWLFGPLTHLLMARTHVLAPLAPNPRELGRMRSGTWSHGLVERVDGVVETHLVRRHPWWRPVFSGRPADPGDGAAWLDAERHESLAVGCGELALVHADLARTVRAARPCSLAAISVSNVPDWLDEAATADLACAVREALVPGGRVLVRRVARPHGPDPFEAAGLERDPASDVLVRRERTALYERVDLYRAPGAAGPRDLLGRPPQLQ